MKHFLIAVAVAVATITPSAFAADIGVSVSIGQPGFYGRLDVGDYPQPQVIYRQPVIIEREVSRPPIYLRVPPGHAKHWSKHCREYNACGERVYFVQNDWYNREYVPRYQEYHRDNQGGHHDEEYRGEYRGNQGGDHHDNGRGHGRGHGHGRDH